MLIRAQRHLRLAVRGPHARTRNLDATTAECHLASLVTMTHSAPIRVPAPLRADDIIDLLLHQLAQNTEPDTDAERQQPFLRCPDQLAQSFLHALREHGLIAGRLRDRYVALHGGSSFDLWTDRRERSQLERTRPEGPPSLQSSTSPGTTSLVLDHPLVGRLGLLCECVLRVTHHHIC